MKVVPIVVGALCIATKGLVQGYGGFRNQRTSGVHHNYSIIKNGQNTVMSPGDLATLADSQIPVRKQQLKLV